MPRSELSRCTIAEATFPLPAYTRPVDTSKLLESHVAELGPCFDLLRLPKSEPVPPNEMEHAMNHFSLRERKILTLSGLPGRLRRRIDFRRQLIVPTWLTIVKVSPLRAAISLFLSFVTVTGGPPYIPMCINLSTTVVHVSTAKHLGAPPNYLSGTGLSCVRSNCNG